MHQAQLLQLAELVVPAVVEMAEDLWTQVDLRVLLILAAGVEELNLKVRLLAVAPEALV